jgi:hypothetical protein
MAGWRVGGDIGNREFHPSRVGNDAGGGLKWRKSNLMGKQAAEFIS